MEEALASNMGGMADTTMASRMGSVMGGALGQAFGMKPAGRRNK